MKLSKENASSAKMRDSLARVAPAKAAANAEPRQKIAEPTPEQFRHGRFERAPGDTEKGQVSARPYRRQPLFETMAKNSKGGVDAEGLRALRYYRNEHETTASSLTRCALDVEGRSGGGGTPSAPVVVMSSFALRACEAAIGAVIDTMRAVALEDLSLSQVAMDRYGSRKQSWIEQEKDRGRTKKGGKMVFVEKMVPKSGRHRDIIREEFALGLKRLVEAVRRCTSTDSDLGRANAALPVRAADHVPAPRGANCARRRRRPSFQPPMKGHTMPKNTNGPVASEELRLLIERVERLEEEKKGIADDIKDVFGEAKARGFDTKTMKEITINQPVVSKLNPVTGRLRSSTGDVTQERVAASEGAAAAVVDPAFIGDDGMMRPLDEIAGIVRKRVNARDGE